jgi:hypothetical protein
VESLSKRTEQVVASLPFFFGYERKGSGGLHLEEGTNDLFSPNGKEQVIAPSPSAMKRKQCLGSFQRRKNPLWSFPSYPALKVMQVLGPFPKRKYQVTASSNFSLQIQRSRQGLWGPGSLTKATLCLPELQCFNMPSPSFLDL